MLFSYHMALNPMFFSLLLFKQMFWDEKYIFITLAQKKQIIYTEYDNKSNKLQIWIWGVMLFLSQDIYVFFVFFLSEKNSRGNRQQSPNFSVMKVYHKNPELTINIRLHWAISMGYWKLFRWYSNKNFDGKRVFQKREIHSLLAWLTIAFWLR